MNGQPRSVSTTIVVDVNYVRNFPVDNIISAATHELGHAVFFNRISASTYYAGNTTPDNKWGFGRNARRAYHRLSGNEVEVSVPMNGDAHWQEGFILPHRDIMEPRWWPNSKIGPITAGAMMDYGYRINPRAIEIHGGAEVGDPPQQPAFHCRQLPDGAFAMTALDLRRNKP